MKYRNVVLLQYEIIYCSYITQQITYCNFLHYTIRLCNFIILW